MSDFEYDLAISFLAADEPVALQLADRLRDRMGVFVYSEQQKALVGKDGVEAFSETFKSKARVVVVLFRDGWGKTKWTRVEETAIKDRVFDEGWDFLVVAALSSDGIPNWLPKTKIWFGFDRFGLDGIAAVLDARVAEQGGGGKEETARDRAARLERRTKLSHEIRLFLASDRGVAAAETEANALFEYVQAEVDAMRAADAPSQIKFEKHAYQSVCAVSTPRSGLVFGWNPQYSNTLEGAELLVREFDRPVFLDGYYRGRKEPIAEEGFAFTRTLEGTVGWESSVEPGRVWSTQALAERFLKSFLDRSHRPPEPSADAL